MGHGFIGKHSVGYGPIQIYFPIYFEIQIPTGCTWIRLLVLPGTMIIPYPTGLALSNEIGFWPCSFAPRISGLNT